MEEGLSPSVFRRLAFIRYLYELAVRQSRLPEPIGAAALLMFHDAAELFLQLACEHLDSGASKPDFMDYWALIERKLPPGTQLLQKESMRRLNRARVALKHHGNLPSTVDLEAFRATATNFFADNMPIVFGLQLADVSLTEFVQPEEARQRLNNAEQDMARGDVDSVRKNAAVAFHIMLNDYERRKRHRYTSPFIFTNQLRYTSSFRTRSPFYSPSPSQADAALFRQLEALERDHFQFVDDVKRTLATMEQAIRVLAFGIDYRRYSLFRMLTGPVFTALGGAIHTDVPDRSTSEEEARFCIDFVIEVAMTLRDFDYTSATHNSESVSYQD